MATAPLVEINQLVVRFTNSAEPVLNNVSLDVALGETVALLGPSGCGKTTLLRAIAGLQPSQNGTIRIDGHDMARVPPHRRGIGFMFQDHALFPHLRVSGNVEFGLRMQRVDPQTRHSRVTEVLELVGLSGLADRPVDSLSGGERQRVALARALAPSPRILMLDEPLGALDRTLRDRLVLDLQEIFVDLGLTVLYVTHDQSEALGLADRIAVMDRGKLIQVGTPLEVWTQPHNSFVAKFIGLTNVVRATVSHGMATTPWGLSVPLSGPDGITDLVIRPEAVTIVRKNDPRRDSAITAKIIGRIFAGDHTRLALEVRADEKNSTNDTGSDVANTIQLDVVTRHPVQPFLIDETVTVEIDHLGVIRLDH